VGTGVGSHGHGRRGGRDEGEVSWGDLAHSRGRGRERRSEVIGNGVETLSLLVARISLAIAEELPLSLHQVAVLAHLPHSRPDLHFLFSSLPNKPKLSTQLYWSSDTTSQQQQTKEQKMSETVSLGSLDYTSPAFILQNINLEENFEVFENFSSDMRLRVIKNICDQVCFYVSCVLKAFLRSERAPSIVIYGAGFLGSTIINALAACGCRPFLRVFTRDKATIRIWQNQGIKASSKLKEGSFIDILILSSNLSSFVQFCRDLSSHISPKTFIISTVFGLRRKRLFNILGTPGIFKTFVERKVALPTQEADPGSPAKKHTLSRSLSSPINFRGNPAALSMNPLAISARFLAGKKDAVRNLIIILENYLILSGIPALTARADALDSIVGADSLHSSVPLSVSDHIGADASEEEKEKELQEVLMAQRSDSSDSHSARSKVQATRRSSLARALTLQPERSVVSRGANDVFDDDDSVVNPNNPLERDELDDNSVSSLDSADKKVRGHRRNALVQAVPRHIKLIRHALHLLGRAYGNEFKKELSRHILIIDLPALPKESGDNFVFNALKKQKKASDRAKRSLIGRTPTRGIVANTSSNWQDFFLKDDSLLKIFSCDSKSSRITDVPNQFVTDLDEESGSENDEEEQQRDGDGEGSEDDPFGEKNPLQRQFYERYYVKKDENDDGMVRTTAPMNLQGLGAATFDSLAAMMESQQRQGS
jgi:hypothetical protein